jgi:hypothetical protein
MLLQNQGLSSPLQRRLAPSILSTKITTRNGPSIKKSIHARHTYLQEAAYATMTGFADDYSTSSPIADACV